MFTSADAKRPGSGSITPLIILWLLIIGIILSACGKLPVAGEQSQDEGVWYLLRQGNLLPIDDPRAEVVELKPWTVQTRIAGMTEFGGVAFLAINGHGLLRIEEPENPSLTYFYDPLIFEHRTLTTVLADEYSLLCHVYFNQMLNTVSETMLTLQGISLIRLRPDSGYQFITPPFQIANPDWESVGFVVNQDLFFEWKHSDAEQTRFYYSRFTPPGQEQAIARIDYQRAYAFQALDAAPNAVRSLFRVARKELNRKGVSTAYQLSIRSPGHSRVQRYQHTPEQFVEAEKIRLYSLPLQQQGDLYWLLLPQGPLLWSNNRGDLERVALPILPQDCRYTDLLISGNKLLLSWEEVRFFQVGKAGLYIRKKPSTEL